MTGLTLLFIAGIRGSLYQAFSHATSPSRSLTPPQTTTATSGISTPPSLITPPPSSQNTPSPLPPPSSSSPSPDPAAKGIPLSSSCTRSSSSSNLTCITQIVRTNFKYPLLRVVEQQRQDSPTAPALVISRDIMVADHIIIRTRPNTSTASLQALCARHHLGIRKTLKSPGYYLLATPDTNPDTLPRLIASLSSETNTILYAEPDHILHTTQTIPDDTSFPYLWALHNTGLSGGIADADIDAPEAWDLTTGSPTVIVGVIDSGVDITHPDLASNIWGNPLEKLNGIDDDGNGYIDDMNGWDFLTEDNNPADANSHGTHVAGTIAAFGNNSLGVVGVSWQCHIMPLRFLDASGNGSTSDAIEALHYATDMRRRGINIRLTSNSWGGGGDQALSDAIRESGDAGLLFIAAAGNAANNNDYNPFLPSNYTWSNIIAVASTDRRDALSSFSNYGASSVDLAAPGSDIYSTLPGGGYGSKNGTSMATPHVSGVAALLWSEWPDANIADIRNAILNSVDRIPALTGKTVTGGRLNAHKALINTFHLIHTPQPFEINNGTNYPITASLIPPRLTDTNQLWLLWNTDGSTNFTSSPLTQIGTNLYQGNIPSQPEWTTINYWLKAVSTAGTTATHPTNAPTTVHHFTIMPSLNLTVSGSPSPHGAVSPDYGTHASPSGLVVSANAPLYSIPEDNSRWACLGWTGAGSAPSSGTSNAFTFTLTEPSSINWLWSHELALSQTSSVPDLQFTTTWWTASSTGTTLTAANSLSLNGTNYIFAHWLLDGTRQPSPSEPAVNPITSIPMTQPHDAAAIYLPDHLDADGDGMDDWWEYRYFGSTNTAPDSDSDNDTFSNLDEFHDGTSPRDLATFPTPPSIQHTPLPDPQDHPAPYPLQAAVTDNFSIASVTLQWSKSNGPIESSPMLTNETPGLYLSELPPPGTNGDVFTYWILARDPLGLISTNGPHTVHVNYPFLHISPPSIQQLVPPLSSTNHPLLLTNLGNTNLLATLTLLPPGYSNTFDDTVTGWTSSGTGNLWTLSTNRSASPPSSWYNGDPSLGLYTSNMHACLDSPPLYLGSNSLMSFTHWISSELDTQYWIGWRPFHAWDGGIVEISTNSGLSFDQITPIDGYPYAISGWEDSPWPDGTPCFAGAGIWRQTTIDLSPYANRLVIIRFHFGSDSNTEREGWYIDDLVITPAPPAESWLSWDPTNLTIHPASTTTVNVTFASGSIPTGDREAALLVTCNDPTAPLTLLPQHMLVRSHPVLSWLSAAQTSTNGEGWVTLSNSIYDADGELCSLDLDWTTNGTTWTSAWIRAASATVGTPSPPLLASPHQVENIPTTNAPPSPPPFTNSLASSWDTSPSGNALGFSTATRVRARLWDGLLWSQWTTSQPFTVDNIPPPPPSRFTNMTHSINTWSTNPSMTLVWRRVTDPALAGYSFSFWTNSPGDAFTALTTDTSASSPPLPDAPAWWTSIRSRDTYGNLSPTLSLGPFKIDTTPPSPSGASLTLSLDPAGAYLIGSTNITASWTAFTDAGSGIARYFCALTNRSPSNKGQITTTPSATLSGLLLDATNTFNVWAMDNAGLIGPAASASFLALSASGDWDHDGMINSAENIAGTDPAQSASLFLLDLQSPRTNDLMILRWPSTTNRLYTLSRSDTLFTPGSNWATMTNWTRVPGVEGSMSCTDQVQNIPVRFYRITVEKP